MYRLNLLDHKVNLQIIYNKVSAKRKCVIKEYWNITYQLVPPEIHQGNAAEFGIHQFNAAKRVIHTFKYHFLAILVGISNAFPK